MNASADLEAPDRAAREGQPWGPHKAYDPITPGENLLTEFLEPLGVTQYRLAQALGVDDRFWTNTQTGYDL